MKSILKYLKLNKLKRGGIILGLTFILCISCNKHKDCEDDIEIFRKSFPAKVHDYENLLTIIKSVKSFDYNNPQKMHDSLFFINKNYKKLIKKLKIELVYKCKNDGFDYGDYNFYISSKKCDYITQSISIIYSIKKIENLDKTKIKIEKIIP